MLKSFFAVALLSTVSTAFLPENAHAAKVETSSCKDFNKVSMTLEKSVNKDKSDTILVARRRRRLIVRVYYKTKRRKIRVGRGTFRCDGSSTLTGRSTPYYRVVLNEPCCGVHPC